MKKITFALPVFLFLFVFYANAQQTLQLSSCETIEYEINDHSDSDDDGIICEARIVLSKSASYSESPECQLSNIKWTVKVDLDSDGQDDLEYSSSLPSDDVTLDDTNNNGIPDLYIPMTSNNEVQNIELPDIEGPSSNHKVRWLVSDDCDLGDLCATNFSVVDKSAPTPFCLSLSTFIYSGGSPNTIYAEDFNIGVFDHCTDNENIRISFSEESIVPTRELNCEDVLNSPVLVKIYFWDESDNTNFCSVYLSVIPTPTTDCFPGGEIAGVVKTWWGEPIEGARVLLEADLLKYPRVTHTDSEGKYTFGEFVDSPTVYSLSVLKNEDHLQGVSTLDFVLIMRHMLGLNQFLNPYQIIAADINNNGNVKANDLFDLRKVILGILPEFPSNNSWKILREDFEFQNNSDPFGDLSNSDTDPFVYKFNQISDFGYDFTGVKIGDVSN